MRTALALSALTRKPFRITRIRAPRLKPGLQPQHLTAVRATAQACGGRVRGAALGSLELEFNPGAVQGGEFYFDVGTAGSASLVAQTLLPCLAFARRPSRVRVRGGTSVPFAPPAAFLRDVFLPAVQRIGVRATARVEREGFYPAGGGEIVLETTPVKRLQSLRALERGELRELRGEIVFSQLPEHVPRRVKTRALELLAEKSFKAKIEAREAPVLSPGVCFLLLADYEHFRAGFSALGKRGKPAERVAEECVREFLEFHAARGAAIDKHLGDQLAVYAAIARGESVYSTFLTQHLLSNARVVEQFFGKVFEIAGGEGEGEGEGEGKACIVTARGRGFENEFI